MKISKHFLMLMSMVVSLSFANAQTPGEIIAKYMDAIGGKEKLSTITSVKSSYTMQIMGTEAPSVTTVLVGKGFRNESEFNGQKIIRVITDKGGWSVNPLAGANDPEPLSEDDYKAGKDQVYFPALSDYKPGESKAELAGKEKVGSADAYKVNVTSKDSVATTYYFDAADYKILKIVKKASMMGQEVEVISTFSDYKKKRLWGNCTLYHKH